MSIKSKIRKGWDDGVYISQRSIWIQDDLNVYEKMLWMCLEKYANGKGVAWPGKATLSRECSMSIAQTKRTIRSLIDKGLLEKEIRKTEQCFETNLYTLYLPHQRFSKCTAGRFSQTPGSKL
ncbi:MAG: hypothetical protein AVO34_05265 [Firmicutes bacterium ML8_F2]|nr:MAG: hypothetical protein AVO34_05265 [Firmicutes bacterium ML8_F2]